MNINEASEYTKLSKKTLRFYESKGLFVTERKENDYRVYSPELIEKIMRIKLLRAAGISVSDILLLNSNMIGLEELLNKQEKNLKESRISNERQLELCREMLRAYPDIKNVEKLLDKEADAVNEEAQSIFCADIPVVLGLDIGTSSLSLAVIDDKGNVLDTFNITNDAKTERRGVQDAENILTRTLALIDVAERTYKNVRAVGIAGQMHGIVYLDSEGNAVSPLYTWQFNEDDGTSRIQARQITGMDVPEGYGLITHYYLTEKGEVPENAAKLCTIMDYICLKLTGGNSPVIHPTNAASLGFYDIKNNCFFIEKLKKLGIDASLLPRCTVNGGIGEYKGAKVYVPIGDHQASFLSVSAECGAEKCVLINFGTGSQITIAGRAEAAQRYNAEEGIELRPFFDGLYLKSYSALCGGYAYALAERFIRSIVYAACGDDSEQYELMARLAMEDAQKKPPIVCTAFCGTRYDGSITGSVTGITPDNFTPGLLLRGIMRGMVQELYDAYRKMSASENMRIFASGNAIRKNKLLKAAVCDIFASDPEVLPDAEEAAVGAALFAMRLFNGNAVL